MVEPKDLKIEVGLKAYEEYFGIKYDRTKLTSIGYETHRSAVYILHLPTGETGYCEEERSQYKNKIKALEMLDNKIKGLSY